MTSLTKHLSTDDAVHAAARFILEARDRGDVVPVSELKSRFGITLREAQEAAQLAASWSRSTPRVRA